MDVRRLGAEFKAEVNWTERFVGVTRLGSSAEVKFGLPKVFGGEEGYVAPEELLLSSLTTCVSVVIWRVLHKMNVEIKSYEAAAKGWLEKNAEGYNRFTEVIITIDLKVHQEKDIEAAKKAVNIAPKYCPIEAAVEGNLRLKIEPSVST